MSNHRFIPQAAALPYRIKPDGGIDVLLICRHDRNRWGIPKGLVDPGNTPAQTAIIESMEEAGIAGQLSSEPVGIFRYRKFGGICEVQVFLLRVREVRARYLEMEFRRRAWFPLEEAAQLVHRQALKRLIPKLPGWVRA